MTPSEQRQLDALIARLEPELQRAFADAMHDLRDGIDEKALIAALERGDIDAAIRALNIEPGAFNAYVTARTAGFAEAGQLVASFIRIPGTDGAMIQTRFDMSNPRAENLIRTMAATRVVGYTQEQTETARRVILEGYTQGKGPQDIATDIAGRINRVTGRREGGIVGLSDPQAGYVQSMRERLESGDPAEMRKVLGGPSGGGMTLRDKRYDRTIKKAIREGQPVPKAMIDKMTARYTDRLLARRAEDIARTETAQSVEAAKAESYRQALDKANMPYDAVEKTWIHSGGIENARMQHLLMHDVSVVGLDTVFVMPDGAQMLYSHDPAGGVRHNANCMCKTNYTLDFSRGVL